MDKDEEKLELLGWLIVKGKNQEEFKNLLGENQMYCRLSMKAVTCLPKEEFAQGKKQPYINLIMEYTNYKEDGKFKRQKENLPIQILDIDNCIYFLLSNGFFSKWIFSYFRGFAKIIEEIGKEYTFNLSEENAESLISAIQKPILSTDVKVLLVTSTAEELAQKITEGNGVRSKIVSALKEDYWIHLGRYENYFGIKKGAYFISDGNFEFLFEVNQMILKKAFQKRTVLSDLSMDLIRLCSRISESDQLEMVESLENACNARLNVGCDTGKSKIRLLASMTSHRQVLYQIKSKFPSMQI